MTNEQTHIKHPYHQILQWVVEGKEIEVHHKESGCYLQLDTNTILRIVLAGTDDKSYKQPQDFRLKPQRHVHQDLIDAFKNGAKIQYWNKTREDWCDTLTPAFCETNNYRIKPEPKPDVTEYIKHTLNWGWTCGIKAPYEEGIKVTRCGETNKIKSIELLEPKND